jgi:hypothetical protein
LDLAVAGQITDRFAKATDQIGSNSIAVRLGALLALDRLSRARDSDNDEFWRVMALLAIWVKERSPWPPQMATSAVTA